MEAKVPKFDEPGVREKVVKAWERIEARKLAEKRGKELAELARKSSRPRAQKKNATSFASLVFSMSWIRAV